MIHPNFSPPPFDWGLSFGLVTLHHPSATSLRTVREKDGERKELWGHSEVELCVREVDRDSETTTDVTISCPVGSGASFVLGRTELSLSLSLSLVACR